LYRRVKALTRLFFSLVERRLRRHHGWELGEAARDRFTFKICLYKGIRKCDVVIPKARQASRMQQECCLVIDHADTRLSQAHLTYATIEIKMLAGIRPLCCEHQN